ncbi:MAG: hypothetical protein MK107_02750 [Oceanicola sp.]|nr:hypothetical protein [Oceanicola sp.]
MQIRYERPVPELTFEVTAPLRLSLGPGLDTVIDKWSLDGIRPPEHLTGDSGSAQLAIPFHGFEISFPIQLKRDHKTGIMRFVDLGYREERVLRHFYRELVTGRSVSTEAMILAMDAPVEKVPMVETSKEEAAGRAATTPRAIRVGMMVALYVGLVGFLYEPLFAPIWEETLMKLSDEPVTLWIENKANSYNMEDSATQTQFPGPYSSVSH